MAVHVYLVKRKLRATGRNGKPKCRYSMRWRDPTSGRILSETCATGDAAQAELVRRAKWEELNGLVEIEAEPAPPPAPKPSWADCGEAARKAMTADNLRQSYVNDSLLLFDGLQRMFPDLNSPADMTFAMANEYKRRRAEQGKSAWTVKGDLATLKALFGKWLGRECGLLESNPFAGVKPPRCDEPEIRIVSATESESLFAWLAERWNQWRLPLVYLQVAALIGWRATEIASMRSEDLLADGHIRVLSESSKTRKHKYAWLPESLYDELAECCFNGWAFGRFSDELRRRLILCRKQPHHAARVKDFSPKRLVGWMQDELQRFNDFTERELAKTRESGTHAPAWQAFTLHDFRRTAITGLQMSGASEKEASVMVGATPEVIRRHYERLDQQRIARRIVERRVTDGGDGHEFQLHRLLRKYSALDEREALDGGNNSSQTVGA